MPAAEQSLLHKGGIMLTVMASYFHRRLNATCSPLLVSAAELETYVVICSNNPAGSNMLIDLCLGSSLGRKIGLRTPDSAVVEFSPQFVDMNASNRDFWMGNHPDSLVKPVVGPHFGTRHLGDQYSFVVGLMPEKLRGRVVNLSDFVGQFCLDVWLASRKAIHGVYGKDDDGAFWVHFENFGPSLCGAVLEGACVENLVCETLPLRDSRLALEDVTGWSDLDEWICRIENTKPETICTIVDAIQPGWYNHDRRAMEVVVDLLCSRAKVLPALIKEYRDKVYDPFPKWRREVPSHTGSKRRLSMPAVQLRRRFAVPSH